MTINARTGGPDRSWFVDIPYRVCAVSGDRKVRVLAAALHGRLITDLVIDEPTAQLLLDNDPAPEDT